MWLVVLVIIMRKSKTIFEISILLVLVFGLIVLTENILKESTIFDVNIVIRCVFLVCGACSMYYFYLITSNIGLYLSFERTRKAIFNESIKKALVILIITFFLTIFTLLINMVIKKDNITMYDLFIKSRVIYLVISFATLSTIGTLVPMIRINKNSDEVIKQILLIVSFLVFLALSFIESIIVFVIILVVEIPLFLVSRNIFLKRNIDL